MSDLKIESGKIYRRMDGVLIAAGAGVIKIEDPYLRLEWELQKVCISHGYHKIPSSEEILQKIADSEAHHKDADSLEALYLRIYYFEIRNNSNFQKMEVGKRYRMYWTDGGIGDYTVVDIKERHFTIVWNNGVFLEIQYTSGIHKKSKPL